MLPCMNVYKTKKYNLKKIRKGVLMDLFLEGLKNGLAMGSIFALMALGYSMVYGIVKMINFAHS